MKFQKGDKVTTTEQTKVLFGYPDGMEGTVLDIVNGDYTLAVNFPELGVDFVEFFNLSELIRFDHLIVSKQTNHKQEQTERNTMATIDRMSMNPTCRTTPSLTPQSPLSEHIERLVAEISGMECLVDSLASRLSPLMNSGLAERQTPQCPEEKGSNCDFIESLKDQIMRLAEINRKLSSIHASLEI